MATVVLAGRKTEARSLAPSVGVAEIDSLVNAVMDLGYTRFSNIVFPGRTADYSLEKFNDMIRNFVRFWQNLDGDAKLGVIAALHGPR